MGSKSIICVASLNDTASINTSETPGPDGHLTVTIPETVETTADDLGAATAR